MLQLKPGLRKPLIRKGPGCTLYDLTFFFHSGDPYRIANANKFPFHEAVPLYLKSQIKMKNPADYQFLFHNVNKKLDKYYRNIKLDNNILKNKYKEAWALMGLRDITMGFQRRDEIVSLQDYWIYKLSSYFDRKLISYHSSKYPRLEEFLKKRRKGDTGRLQFFKRMVKENQNYRMNPIKKRWLRKQFEHELDFTKNHLRYMNVFFQTNMGNKNYNEARMQQMYRATAILNMFYNIFGMEKDPEINKMLKQDQKLFKTEEEKGGRVMSLVIKTKPKFDERQALQSICRKHFKEIFQPPKLPLKQEKILTREKFVQENKMKIKRNITLPAKRISIQQYAIKGRFFEKADQDDALLEGIKKDLLSKGVEKVVQEKDLNQEIKREIIPYHFPQYESSVLKTQRSKRIHGFFKFFEDFERLITASDAEVIRIPNEKLKVVVSVTDFIKQREHEVEKFTERTESSILTIPGDSSSSDGEKHGEQERKQTVGDATEEPAEDKKISDAFAEVDEEERKHKTTITEPEPMKKGRWRLMSVKKATYIILRFLNDLSKQRYLPDKQVIEDSFSEKSSLPPPPNENLQFPPLIALMNLLSEKRKTNDYKSPLIGLEKCAKNMYKKIKRKDKRMIATKCREYQNLYSMKSGIPFTDDSFPDLLAKWDSQDLIAGPQDLRNVSSLSSLHTESDESAIIDLKPTIFDWRGRKSKEQKRVYLEFFSLLLCFLNVANKILRVRQALKEFNREKGGDARRYGESRLKEEKNKAKINKETKTLSLPQFRKFLQKNYGLHNVNEYVATAQRYCPDYVFYESKKELRKPVVVAPTVSGEEIGLAMQAQESKGMVAFKEEDSEVSSSINQPTTEKEKPKGKKAEKEFEDGNSYVSWKGPPCADDFSGQKRVYFVKHSTDWAPFADYSDISIDKKFLSSDFFEFPSSLGIPRLVTRYYRHLPKLKLPDSYILDPRPESFRTRNDKRLPFYEKYDSDLSSMSKYFNIFWLSENKKEYTKEEVQKNMFLSWCGDLVYSVDDSWKFFDKFCEIIDTFEKETKPVKKIFDVDTSSQNAWEWMKVNKYLKNVSPIDLLDIHKWVRQVNKRLNEYPFLEEGNVQRQSQSFLEKVTDNGANTERSRLADMVEEPEGFPLSDVQALKEALKLLIEEVKRFRSYRFAPYGENYRPITECYLKGITEECGFVETNDEPSDHPNIRLAPSRAICYSDKEKQFYYHSNNFIDNFQRVYPQRFMKMPFHVRNEYGSMKHVCTFISTRRMVFPKLNTWKGCMRTVSNKLVCEQLKDPCRPPRMMKSPFTTLQERKGNVFELSILLTGLLIAAGYDAYCVCGTATFHRSFYGNTDDVSPDESDIEAPSTNRYVQYNLLPPFSARWYKDSLANYDPIPYEDMEICKVNREKKKLFLEEYKTWPQTDREVFAEYDKELEEVEHKSRFDNPAIALPNRRKKVAVVEEGAVECGTMATKKLDDLYEKLIAERCQRADEERKKEEAKKKSLRTYIHENPTELKSHFEEIRKKGERIEMKKKREEKKMSKNNSQIRAKFLEEVKYFEWLYGPHGPHPEYAEMLKKDKERTFEEATDLQEINLLQFTEFYDPRKHRLEVVTGEKLHYYGRDSLKSKKYLRRKDDDVWMMDTRRLERIKTRRAQYKKAEEPEQKKKKLDLSEAPITESVTPAESKRGSLPRRSKGKGRPLQLQRTVTSKEIKINQSIDAVTHRAKLLASPFIRKLWLNLSRELPNINILGKLKLTSADNPRKLRRKKKAAIKIEDFSNVIKMLEGTYFLKHLNPATLEFIEPILQKANQTRTSDLNFRNINKARCKKKVWRRIKKAKEQKLLNKRPYIPSRIHCWVLIREGTRSVEQPFFIDVFTGVPYPVSDYNYLKISCAWNDKNYYIPRCVATHHKKTRKFNFSDNTYWFHLLPLEPMSTVVEKKRKPWWWDIKGHPHILQHIEMPPYWGRRLRIPQIEWGKMFPNSNKKSFYYKRAVVEAYDRDGRPADGLMKRISRFLDMKRTILESIDTKFEFRKDCLMWRHFHVNSGYVEERFAEGRPDHLKCWYLAFLLPGLYTTKEFQFYGNRREDKLSLLLISDKGLIAEFKEGRMDHLKRVKYNYSRSKTDRRLYVIDEYSRNVKRVCARYRRLSFHFLPWKQYFKEFTEIPLKLEINMNCMFSEYWYWDEELEAPVKWVGEHVDEASEGFVKSKSLKMNPFIDTEPILYGVGKNLQDTPFQFTKRKEQYEKRENEDRVYLMALARTLEQTVCDIVILREYEKIMDVLCGADELKRLHIPSERAMYTMKAYFEAESNNISNSDWKPDVPITIELPGRMPPKKASLSACKALIMTRR